MALVASWAVATRHRVPEWEASLTRWFNRAPDWVADGLWPVMQLGTLWAPLALALLVGVLRRDWLLAVCSAGAGVSAWVGAKAVKEVVGRGRPVAYLSEIEVRDGWAQGLGYLSGHSATAAVTVIMAMALLPRRARPVLGATALLVGVARMVHGVHLAADVVGGWAFGTLVAVGALAVYDRARSRRQPVSRSAPVTS